MKITLTIGQLKRLIKESEEDEWAESMNRVVDDFMRAAKRYPDTVSVEEVPSELGSPSDEPWKRVQAVKVEYKGNITGSFEIISPDSVIYTIKAADGTLLAGNPDIAEDLKPKEVVDWKMYVRNRIHKIDRTIHVAKINLGKLRGRRSRSLGSHNYILDYDISKAKEKIESLETKKAKLETILQNSSN